MPVVRGADFRFRVYDACAEISTLKPTPRLALRARCHARHACRRVTMEQDGPYRFVRHPGYLGSLLSLNGIGLGSGSAPVFVASIVTTFAAYAYRIRVEDSMLVAAFGASYERYRREVRALLPGPPTL